MLLKTSAAGKNAADTLKNTNDQARSGDRNPLMKIATNVALGANTPYYGRPVTIAFLLGSVVLVAVIANLRTSM
jgi:hypothetical protein